MLSICFIYLLLSSALGDPLILEDIGISPFNQREEVTNDGSTTTPSAIDTIELSITSNTATTSSITSTITASSISSLDNAVVSLLSDTTVLSTESTTLSSTITTTSPSTISTTPTTTTQSPQITDITETSFTWTETSESNMIEVTVDEGLMISVTISKLNLNGDNQDFLVIKSGSSLEDTSESGRKFAYSIDNPVKYLFDSNRVFGYFCDAVSGDNSSDFTVVFERFGNITTTTSTIPTTTIDWPTTEAGDSIEITVNITGKTLEEFTNETVIDDLRKCIAEMATAYCKDSKINLLEEITETNVRIKEIDECPFNWPNSETCVQVTFSLPIYYDYKIWSGYQMDTDHLEEMWSKYAEQYLDENFDIYDAPNINKIITWWAVAIICVVIIFIIIIIAVKCLRGKFRNTYRRRLSDTLSIVPNRRVTDVSLTPHYLQDTPKLFDNKYPLMDPEF